MAIKKLFFFSSYDCAIHSVVAMATSVSLQRLLAIALIAAVSLAGVALLTEVELYQKLVIPDLPRLQFVPVQWWVGIFSPLVLSMLLLGYFCCSVRSVLASALGGTVGLIAREFVMAHLNQPGHLKSLAFEAPLLFLTTSTPILFGTVLLIVLTGFGARRLGNQAITRS
jgi:hypothetical protein